MENETMAPTQKIDIHVDGNTKVTIHIDFDEKKDKFGSEAIILDGTLDPGKSTRVGFGEGHDTASKAFEAAFHWIAQWSAARDLPIIAINNPGDSGFLSLEDQARVVRQSGMEIPVTVE
jgi:hypothetical protein